MIDFFRHFSDIKHPDRMDAGFMSWLDYVRHNSKISFYVTSDWRDPWKNTSVGGNALSLHLTGNAIDFGTAASIDRDNQSYYVEINEILYWVFDAERLGENGYRSHQIELVRSPTDYHIHLALYPEGDTRPSKVIIAAD